MKKNRVLIIEDDKDVRENIHTLLYEEGYEVYSCESGEKGVELAKEYLPNIIVCDILMNGMDGYAVLTELSKFKKTRPIPFIYLTAKVERDDIRKGMQLGADDYLFKPFKSDELLQSIKARLKKREALKAESIQDAVKEKKNSKATYNIDDKIFLNISGKPHIVAIKDIVYIAAENQYTSIKTVEGKSILVRKSISAWELILPPKIFLRIHRATIINTDHISKMEKWYNSSFLVYLKEIKEPFVISKRYSTQLRRNQI
ncbi:MAG: response regulator [Ignavibacteria bacterium]|nr:response regulator [Ignavibacteria bacterium]